jgi:hypothetical protein
MASTVVAGVVLHSLLFADGLAIALMATVVTPTISVSVSILTTTTIRPTRAGTVATTATAATTVAVCVGAGRTPLTATLKVIH